MAILTRKAEFFEHIMRWQLFFFIHLVFVVFYRTIGEMNGPGTVLWELFTLVVLGMSDLVDVGG